MKQNTKKIVQLAKEKSKLTREAVIEGLDRLKEKNEDITFSSVAKEANVSRNYLYNSEEFRPIIKELRKKPVKKSVDTKDLIIEAQKEKIAELSKELERYELEN